MVIFSDETQWWLIQTIVSMCGDDLMKFGDLNVSKFVEILNVLLCSGVVSLIKESELLRKLRGI